MLRMYVAQQCFGLSDEGIEDAIYDSQAIRGFVGIDLNRESAPDATTLLKFRHLLEANGLTRKIFDTINGHLAEKGLMMREGDWCIPGSRSPSLFLVEGGAAIKVASTMCRSRRGSGRAVSASSWRRIQGRKSSSA
jgi:IS5 family transposase